MERRDTERIIIHGFFAADETHALLLIEAALEAAFRLTVLEGQAAAIEMALIDRA